MILAACLLAVGWMGPQIPMPQDQIPQEPFTYLLYPSDVVGFMDSPHAFQLTYDGALNNGFGEFQLLAGKNPKLIDVRAKQLYPGSIPCPWFSFECDGIKFRVLLYAAPKGLDPRENLVAYVNIRAENPGPSIRETKLVAQFAPRGPRWRAEMPCREWYRERFMDLARWQSGSAAGDRGGMVSKADHLVFTYSGQPVPSHRDGPGVEYSLRLQPNETTDITFKVPSVPVDLRRDAQVNAVVQADPKAVSRRVSAFWHGIYDRATQIELPEAKVEETVKASLAYLLIARDVLEDGKSFMPTVNKFQYHSFFFRDAAFTTHTFDLMNLPDVARSTVQYYFETNPDGSARDLKRSGEDDWGQSLWAVGAHFRATNDLAFAKFAYPVLAPHLKYFHDKIASDPYHLWPVLGPYDAELLTGHYTSHSFWVLLGLREAINLAKATGHPQDAIAWQELHDAYRHRFMTQLARVTAKSGGYIPPGIDRPQDGRDWENATAGVYPFGVIDKSDPRVATTLRMVREYKWREGISTWGTNAWVIKTRGQAGIEEDPGTLHHYETYNVTQTALACGRQVDVLEDLYSALAHTSATHAGFEMGTRPWGERDVSGNYSPHGWFAARTIELVRNMLVREEADNLHLTSCLSPQWIGPGQTIRLKNAPTNFGLVSFVMRSRKDGADIELSAKWRTAPKTVVVHMPFFVKLDSATVDGRRIPAKGDTLSIPPRASRILLNWHWTEKPDLSYDRAVELWKAKDKDRSLDRNFLFAHPVAPKVDTAQRAFATEAQIGLFNSSRVGELRYTTDGSDPSRISRKYTGPIKVGKSTLLKAICTWPDGRVSEPLWAQFEVGFANIPFSRAATKPGVLCEFYPGKFDHVPDFGQLTPTRQTILAAFGLGEPEPKEELYALRLTGVIEIPKDGSYRFWTGSDDGSRLWIGKRLVVDSDGLHAYSEVSGEVALRKGSYPITVGYFEAGSGHFLRVFWSGPGFEKQEIPAARLGQ